MSAKGVKLCWKRWGRCLGGMLPRKILEKRVKNRAFWDYFEDFLSFLKTLVHGKVNGLEARMGWAGQEGWG